MLNDAQLAVTSFHQVFGVPIQDVATILPRERVNLRANWMDEEIEEFRKAETIVEQADAIADLVFFAIGVFVEMGIDGGKVFELVYESNMRKLGETGKPLLNEDGKIVKPNGWVSPNQEIELWLSSVGMLSQNT